ncbi:MAG: hypothetical protein AMR96_02115 [Candidatus Adiutrix intracellularis]|nr:MAG: hypothetical protein AMR96_02115 [Candidatus Adiutrix intracellularis]
MFFYTVFMLDGWYDIIGFRLVLLPLSEKLKRYTNSLGIEFILVLAGFSLWTRPVRLKNRRR